MRTSITSAIAAAFLITTASAEIQYLGGGCPIQGDMMPWIHVNGTVAAGSDIEIQVTGTPNTPGVFAVAYGNGLEPDGYLDSGLQALPVVGTDGCQLMVNPAFEVPFVTDWLGNAYLPNRNLQPGAAFTVQGIFFDVFGGGLAGSTSGLYVEVDDHFAPGGGFEPLDPRFGRSSLSGSALTKFAPGDDLRPVDPCVDAFPDWTQGDDFGVHAPRVGRPGGLGSLSGNAISQFAPGDDLRPVDPCVDAFPDWTQGDDFGVHAPRVGRPGGLGSLSGNALSQFAPGDDLRPVDPCVDDFPDWTQGDDFGVLTPRVGRPGRLGSLSGDGLSQFAPGDDLRPVDPCVDAFPDWIAADDVGVRDPCVDDFPDWTQGDDFGVLTPRQPTRGMSHAPFTRYSTPLRLIDIPPFRMPTEFEIDVLVRTPRPGARNTVSLGSRNEPDALVIDVDSIQLVNPGPDMTLENIVIDYGPRFTQLRVTVSGAVLLTIVGNDQPLGDTRFSPLHVYSPASDLHQVLLRTRPGR